MILQSSLISGWEKLELCDHTHLALFGLLVLVCVLEVILLKMTTSAGLLVFTRPHYYDPDYDDSGEYEEDIYYEDLQTYYDQWARRQMSYRHRQHEQEQQILQQQQHQNHYNINEYSNDQNNYFLNNYHTNTTDVFRFVY